MQTIFHKILAGEIPSSKVYEDEFIYAFHDIQPVAPVHVLVIPKFFIESLRSAHSVDPADMGKFIIGISKVASFLGLDENGYRVVFNSGKLAMQSVPYLHAHIISGRDLTWPPG